MARGEEIYERKFKKEFENKYCGKFAIIDITTEKAYLGYLSGDALQSALHDSPHGIYHLDFEAVFDTGFTGFLSMPLMEAFPLGLVLQGAESVVFANGTEEMRLTAYGTVTVGTQSCKDVILLEPDSGEVLTRDSNA